MAIRISRVETFSAGHTLFNPLFSQERNREIFGDCANPNGHGHNYQLEVTLEGEVDTETGYLYDLKELSELLHKRILDDVDHRNLNTDVEWLSGRIPTTEVLADVFWGRIESHLPSGLLYSVSVQETPKNRAQRVR